MGTLMQVPRGCLPRAAESPSVGASYTYIYIRVFIYIYICIYIYVDSIY